MITKEEALAAVEAAFWTGDNEAHSVSEAVITRQLAKIGKKAGELDLLEEESPFTTSDLTLYLNDVIKQVNKHHHRLKALEEREEKECKHEWESTEHIEGDMADRRCSICGVEKPD